MDLFVTPTIGFDVLYTFIIVRLARRDHLRPLQSLDRLMQCHEGSTFREPPTTRLKKLGR
jgi:hypothetical protein